MKKMLLSIFILVVIASCKKVACDCDLPVVVKLGFDSGCIVRAYSPIEQQLITDSVRLVLTNLFVKNGIDTSVYKFSSFISRNYKKDTPPYSEVNSKWVGVNQYYKGERIFYNEISFYFENDVLDTFYREKMKAVNYTIIGADSTLQLGQLRFLFMRDLDAYQSLKKHFNASCMRAESGYFQYDSSTLYKSWLVSPLNESKPSSLYYDSTAYLVSYTYY